PRAAALVLLQHVARRGPRRHARRRCAGCTPRAARRAGRPMTGRQSNEGLRPRAGGPRQALVALCMTQVVGWGVLYYSFPVALPAIVADTGWTSTSAMAAFSAALV